MMKRIDTLLKELCPNGVEYKKLGDIATDIFRGSGITRKQITEKGTPCVRYGEIYTTYGIYFDNCVSHTDESTINSKKYFEHGDILFAITGESVEDIAKSTAYIGHEMCLAGGDIVVLKHNQNPKYLSYVLSTTSVQAQKSNGKVKSKVVHSSVPAIKDIVIPVPPLEVQNEIVRILDNFTELTAELTAELEARKKQYEYYRDYLLSFKEVGEVQWVKLESIADIGTGSSNTNEAVENGLYPFYVRSQEQLRKDTYEYDETAIITAGDGVGVGKVFHFVEGKYALHQRAYRIHINDRSVMPKYFYHYMVAKFYDYIAKEGFHSSVSSIRRPMLNNFPLPIPPLEIQNRIVNVLDNFDAICTDLKIGLPAEIEARKKQYEFFRDLLLTFDLESATIVKSRAEQSRAEQSRAEQSRADVIKLLQYVFGYAPVRLGDITEYSKERINSVDVDKNSYVGVDNLLQDKQGKTVSDYVPDKGVLTKFNIGNILIGNIRPYLKKIWLAECEGGTNGDVLCINITDKNVYPKYLYYVLSSDEFFYYDIQRSKGAKMPRGDKQSIMQYSFMLPTYSEQVRVANILDYFNTLCNDISEGLPAEIEARQKQYEYYRDKLLTFKIME